MRPYRAGDELLNQVQTHSALLSEIDRRGHDDSLLQQEKGHLMPSKHKVKVGRAYDPRVRGDGLRVLVDRIWPRGLSKEKADLDEWCKEVAPSTTLRKWYGHVPKRFEEFGRRYQSELEEPVRAEALSHLRDLARRRALTLLTASKRADISEAVVLVDLLQA